MPDALVPLFHLYGEQHGAATGDWAEFIHIEEIQARSRGLGWEIRPHAHRGLIQALFLQDGSGETILDDRVLPARGPCVVVVPPTAVHGFHFAPETRGWVLTVAESLMAGTQALPARSLLQDLCRWPAVLAMADGFPAPLLEHLAEEFAHVRPGRAAMLDCLVHALLLVVWRRAGEAAPAPVRDRVRAQGFARFRALVEDHYRDHWPVARYATAMGTTAGRLNRLVGQVTGGSAFDMISERLMLEARRKLIHLAVPVTALAYELGFQDPAYFCRFFKRRAGLSPAQFRRQAAG